MFLSLVPATSTYQSYIDISSVGHEFQSRNSLQLILQITSASRLHCSLASHQHFTCRAFDYDSVSGRCRLFEGDLTTGSIVPSLSPTSSVGVFTVSPGLFSQIHDKSCQACEDSRYETCSPITQQCQCGPHTFWDGSMCSLQEFENDSCSQVNACRADLNLVCTRSINGSFINCLAGALDRNKGLIDLCTLRLSRRASEIRDDEHSTRAPYCVEVEQSHLLGCGWS